MSRKRSARPKRRPSDEFAPDLSSLSRDYEILSNLRSSTRTRVYLARHRGLNRDVTISVSRVPQHERNALTHFASDARMLATIRHRNVVPVVEARWLSTSTFAIVRAHARGATLSSTIARSGPLDTAQAAAALEQVHAALEWARNNGIMHRRVSADTLLFQQGSGRVLLELELSPPVPSGTPDACDDARTIGELAFEMLSGQRELTGGKRLADLRPDLPPNVARDTEALMRCNKADATRDAMALMAMLAGKSRPVAPPRPTAPPPAPVVKPSLADVSLEEPVNPLEQPEVAVHRKLGQTARLASGVAVLAIISVLGLVLIVRQNGEATSAPPTSAPPASKATTKSAVGGEVALSAPQQAASPDTVVKTPPAPDAAVKAPPPAVQTKRIKKAAPVDTPASLRPIAPPPTRRHEPPRELPRLGLPAPSALISKPAASDSGSPNRAVKLNACYSIEPEAQQQCLYSEVDRGDREMNEAFDRLIGALRQRANVPMSERDPPSVDSLRQAHQRWIRARDAACRNVGTGALYARARVQCYAGQSAKRLDDLQAQLGAVRSP
jgi:serine/threonine-protein kinase